MMLSTICFCLKSIKLDALVQVREQSLPKQLPITINKTGTVFYSFNLHACTILHMTLLCLNHFIFFKYESWIVTKSPKVKKKLRSSHRLSLKFDTEPSTFVLFNLMTLHNAIPALSFLHHKGPDAWSNPSLLLSPP